MKILPVKEASVFHEFFAMVACYDYDCVAFQTHLEKFQKKHLEFVVDVADFGII